MTLITEHQLLPGLILFGIVLVLANRFRRWSKAAYSFTSSPLMSAAEIRFFRVLQVAAPNELVFPQVGMAAVVRPNYAGSDSRFIPAFRSISQKRLDFVVCYRDSLEVRCLVELDDSSHDAKRDRDRDAVTTMAGYRTVRAPASRRYDIDGLRRQVLDRTTERERITG